MLWVSKNLEIVKENVIENYRENTVDIVFTLYASDLSLIPGTTDASLSTASSDL